MEGVSAVFLRSRARWVSNDPRPRLESTSRAVHRRLRLMYGACFRGWYGAADRFSPYPVLRLMIWVRGPGCRPPRSKSCTTGSTGIQHPSRCHHGCSVLGPHTCWRWRGGVSPRKNTRRLIEAFTAGGEGGRRSGVSGLLITGTSLTGTMPPMVRVAGLPEGVFAVGVRRQARVRQLAAPGFYDSGVRSALCHAGW